MSPRRPQKVLLIKPSSLGDVISSVPVLRGLRRSFPQAHIAWLVVPGCAGLLAGEQELNELIEFDRRHFGQIGRSARATRDFVTFCRALRQRRFDWVIDLQGLFRSGFFARVSGAPVRAGFASARELATMFYTHPIDTHCDHTIDRNIELARAIGIDARAEDLTITPTAQAAESVASQLAGLGIAPGQYVVVAPATRWPTKLYPPRHWRKVIAELTRERPVVLAGAPDEQALCAELAEPFDGAAANLAGRTSLPELVGLLASAAAVVCCDSAANFLAPAVGTPSVTLIGPTQAHRTGPYGPLARALLADVPCQGCLKRRCTHITCMQAIEPSRVVAAVTESLAQT